MYLVQLGPATTLDRHALAIARRVARFAARPARRVAKPELKDLSRRRLGAVRFTPPPQA